MTNETKILCKQRLGGYLGIGDHLTVEPLDIWCQTTQLHGGWEPCGKMIAYIYTGASGLSMRPSSTTSCKQHHPVHNNYPDHPKSQEKVEACVASSHYIWGALLCLLRKTEAYRSSLRSSAQVECCEAHTMHGLQIWGPSILLPTFFPVASSETSWQMYPTYCPQAATWGWRQLWIQFKQNHKHT